MKRNIALIGVGRWGKNHLKTLTSISEVENIFVVDSNENFDLKILDSYDNVKFFTCLNSLLENENNIDGAIINGYLFVVYFYLFRKNFFSK